MEDEQSPQHSVQNVPDHTNDLYRPTLRKSTTILLKYINIFIVKKFTINKLACNGICILLTIRKLMFLQCKAFEETCSYIEERPVLPKIMTYTFVFSITSVTQTQTKISRL